MKKSFDSKSESNDISEEDLEKLVVELDTEKLLDVNDSDFAKLPDNLFDDDYISNSHALHLSGREKEIDKHHVAISNKFFAKQITRLESAFEMASKCDKGYELEIAKVKRRINNVSDEGLPWTMFDKIKVFSLTFGMLIIVVFSILTLGGLVIDSELDLFENKLWLAYGLGVFSWLLGLLIEGGHYFAAEVNKKRIQKTSTLLAIVTFLFWGGAVVILFTPNLGDAIELGNFDDDNFYIIKDTMASYVFMAAQFFSEVFLTATFAIAIERIVASKRPIFAVRNEEYMQLKKLLKRYLDKKAHIYDSMAKYKGLINEIEETKKIFVNSAIDKFRECRYES
jgi:hypothetical protein